MVDIQRLQDRVGGGGAAPIGPLRKITLACAASATGCAGAATGAVLACAAAIETLGGLSAACVAALTASAGVCGTAVNNCGNAPNQEYDFLTTAAGATDYAGAVLQNLVCRDNQRVDGMTVNWASHDGTVSIRNIVLHCTDGQLLSFGGGSSSLYGGVTCPKAYLMQGMNIYSSSKWVTAAQARCDKAWDNTLTDTITPKWGGDATNRVILSCPEGSYMSGLKTWNTSTILPNYKYIQRIALNCRSGN